MQYTYHGFSNEFLLSTLYCDLFPKYWMLLDTASNGNFLGKGADQGMLLVLNLAKWWQLCWGLGSHAKG